MPEKRTPDPARLRDKALAYLARREHSRFELTRKLERAGFELGDIKPVLDELEEKEWLSDRRFAESYVAVHATKHGLTKLFHDLRKKGIGKSLIADTLQNSYINELETARAVLSQKLGDTRRLEKAKLMRFLQSRGFSSEVIHKLTRQN